MNGNARPMPDCSRPEGRFCPEPSYCAEKGRCSATLAEEMAAAAAALQLSKTRVSETLKKRGHRYGDFTDNAALSQSLKGWLRRQIGYTILDDTKREALEMIAQKIARILNGDPEYKDNWHDIAGYATLAEERCRDEEAKADSQSKETVGS